MDKNVKKYKITENATVLQNYNNELVKYISGLVAQREKLSKTISIQEQEKQNIYSQISELNNKVDNLNKNLNENLHRRDLCEKTLQETEIGYEKILESLNVLLRVAQNDKIIESIDD